jgi:hypothetical protein
MAGAFYYTVNQNSSKAAQKIKEIEEKAKKDIAAAKSEEEKREIQRKADLELEKAKMAAAKETQEAAMKLREEQLKRAEARVESEMKKAGETITEARKLKEESAKEKAYADLKKKEAEEAMKKAQETNDANDKKLAEEKKRLAEEAQKKVNEANKKADEAIALAKKEAKKAVELKKRLDNASAKVKKKEELARTAEAPKKEAPKKEREFVKVKIYTHGPTWYGTRRCRRFDKLSYCSRNLKPDVLRLYKFNGRKPQHYLLAADTDKAYRFCKGDGHIKCRSKAPRDEDAYKENLVFTIKRTQPGGPGNKHNFHLFNVNDEGKEIRCGLGGPQGRWQCPGRMPKYRIDRV